MANTTQAYFKNNARTTIVTDGGGTITVASVASFPTQFPFLVTAENSGGSVEIIQVNSAAGNVWTVTRAREGTTQLTFASNDVIEQRLTAAQIQNMVNDLVAIDGPYLAGNALSLTGKTFAISNSNLVAIAALTGTANTFSYFTGPGAVSLTTISPFSRTTLAGADAATWRTSLDAVAKSGDTFTGAVNLKQGTVNTNSLDLATGNVFQKTVTANTTFTVANVPLTTVLCCFIFEVVNGGAFTLTWWSGVKWPGGTAPTFTTSGKDLVGFMTYDGGVNWTGIMLAKDVK